MEEESMIAMTQELDGRDAEEESSSMEGNVGEDEASKNCIRAPVVGNRLLPRFQEIVLRRYAQQ